MLTKKELLRIRKSKGRLYPLFISTSDPLFLELATHLCEVLTHCLGKTKHDWEEIFDEASSMFDVHEQVFLGFKKICEDAVKFHAPENNLEEFRKKIFEASFECLYKVEKESIDNYQNRLCEFINSVESPHTVTTIQNTLYSDLPEHHVITDVKQYTAHELLNKYNVSLVQGLLFNSKKITICIPSSPELMPYLRQLLRCLKFFQLIVFFKKEETQLVIEVDGPLSLFQNVQKYGFKLACFFPSILSMPKWTLSAHVDLKKNPEQVLELVLDEKCQLTQANKNFSAYIPEEFNLFAESFLKLNQEKWMIEERCLDVLFDGQEYFFPDFSFRNQETGEIVMLELFHPWHKAALVKRIQHFKKFGLSVSYFIGVSKDLLKDSHIKTILDDKGSFPEVFLFRDVLSPKHVLEALEKC